MKSIAERKIADYFAKKNIKYAYEQELKGRSFFDDSAFCVPDFYLPDYDVYVEYWGLVDVDDEWKKAQYVRSMKRKMAIYYRKNIKFARAVFRRKFKKVTGVELPS